MRYFRIFSLIFLLNSFLFGTVHAQDEETRKLRPFTKVIVSPLIDVVLINGEEESIMIVTEGLSLDKVNTRNSGKTLKIFLDNARMGTNNQKLIDPNDPDVLIRRSRYYGKRVKVYVTYKNIERFEMRGEGTLLCEGRLASQKLKVKIMGEVEATFASIDTKRFVLSSFGENEIYIGGGAANKQVYRIFGESNINTTNVNSELTKISVFGAGDISISVDDALKLKTFGESNIYYMGNPQITRSLIFGDVTIRAI